MPSPFKLFVAAATARTYPRVAWLFRSRGWMIQETVLPVLMMAATATAYRAMLADAPDAAATFHRYVGQLVLGAAMVPFWLNVLWGMGAQLYWERDSGNLELYVMSPAPLMAILTGMALGGLTTTVVRSTAILISGVLLFGVAIPADRWGPLAGAFVLTLAALYGLGMMFSSLFLRWGREAWHLVNLLQEPIYLVSGTNFPLRPVLDRLKVTGLAAAVSLFPLAAGLDAMRQAAFGDRERLLAFRPSPGWREGLFPFPVELLTLAVLGAVFLLLARRLLRDLERRAREDGRITVRWQ